MLTHISDTLTDASCLWKCADMLLEQTEQVANLFCVQFGSGLLIYRRFYPRFTPLCLHKLTLRLPGSPNMEVMGNKTIYYIYKMTWWL